MARAQVNQIHLAVFFAVHKLKQLGLCFRVAMGAFRAVLTPMPRRTLVLVPPLALPLVLQFTFVRCAFA